MAKTDGDDIIDTKSLDAIVKALKNSTASVKVGILKDSKREGSDLGNAEIGAKHEFGESGMPVRSFLKVPIAEHMQEYLDKSGAFTPAAVKEITATKSIAPWLQKLAILAESIVADGFASNGFGKWAPWRGTYKSKTGNILVDTTQLRNSITSEVKE